MTTDGMEPLADLNQVTAFFGMGPCSMVDADVLVGDWPHGVLNDDIRTLPDTPAILSNISGLRDAVEDGYLNMIQATKVLKAGICLRYIKDESKPYLKRRLLGDDIGTSLNHHWLYSWIDQPDGCDQATAYAAFGTYAFTNEHPMEPARWRIMRDLGQYPDVSLNDPSRINAIISGIDPHDAHDGMPYIRSLLEYIRESTDIDACRDLITACLRLRDEQIPILDEYRVEYWMHWVPGIIGLILGTAAHHDTPIPDDDIREAMALVDYHASAADCINAIICHHMKDLTPNIMHILLKWGMMEVLYDTTVSDALYSALIMDHDLEDMGSISYYPYGLDTMRFIIGDVPHEFCFELMSMDRKYAS